MPWLVVALLLTGCTATREAVDDAGAPDGDDGGTRDAGFDAGPKLPPVCPDGEAPVTGCSIPDEACPADHPHPGGPCVNGLECEYREFGGEVDTIFTYTCEGSTWQIDGHCDGASEDPYYYEYASCDLTPPLVETCDAPFDGTIEGALVEIGPPSTTEPFRPFEPGEAVPLIGGGQGASMIELRFRIGCVEAPDCVFIRTRVETDGWSDATVARVVLRCGESLSVWAIISPPCDYELDAAQADVTLEIPGIGTAHATLEIPTQGCYG